MELLVHSTPCNAPYIHPSHDSILELWRTFPNETYPASFQFCLPLKWRFAGGLMMACFYLYIHVLYYFLCPQRNFGRHIVIALSVRPSVRRSVRPSVRPSRFRVRSISPIFFEVGISKLVCGCILGWQSVAYHFQVTVTLTLTSDLVFRIIVSGAYLLYYTQQKKKRTTTIFPLSSPFNTKMLIVMKY